MHPRIRIKEDRAFLYTECVPVLLGGCNGPPWRRGGGFTAILLRGKRMRLILGLQTIDFSLYLHGF